MCAQLAKYAFMWDCGRRAAEQMLRSPTLFDVKRLRLIDLEQAGLLSDRRARLRWNAGYRYALKNSPHNKYLAGFGPLPVKIPSGTPEPVKRPRGRPRQEK